MATHEKVDVDNIEHARYIILALQKETNILIEEGENTEQVERMENKIKALDYIESLILEDLRKIFY